MPAINKLTLAQLRQEIARREKAGQALLAKRQKMAKQLADLDAQIARLGLNGDTRSGRKPGGKPSRPAGRGPKASASEKTGRRTRTKSAVTLPDAIATSMEVRAVVTPKEAAELVIKNGYKTTSKTFGIQVATTLAKDPRFKRVGRGLYERVK